MIIDDDTRRFIIHRMKWVTLFMGAGIILLFLLPFPLDFISITGLLDEFETTHRNAAEIKTDSQQFCKQVVNDNDDDEVTCSSK
jgi:hypothetical protein